MQQPLSEHQRQKYLHTLGIPVWIRRESQVVVDVPPAGLGTNQANMTSVTEYVSEDSPYNPSPNIPQQAVVNSSVKELTAILSEPIKADHQSRVKKASDNPSYPKTQQVDYSAMSWEALQAQALACQNCGLYQSRNQAILGEGNLSAQTMIIGDAPSSEDDRYGSPFQGLSGLLLTNMLSAIDIPRNSVYLTYNVNCRPANDRSPSQEELSACYGLLSRQLDLLKPQTILILGLISAQQLLKTKAPLSKLRGQIHQLPDSNISAVVTYHPRYLLKRTSDKRKTWEDLKLLRQLNSQIVNIDES